MLVIPISDMDEDRRKRICALQMELEKTKQEIALEYTKNQKKKKAALMRWARQKAIS